ncbi:hypothetical protein IPA_08945 [Ignicoccus pacificus DSM 13166]|uniref:Glycosyltransferase subfamily 4-like N-terminal domain-containing protein n=1 Tax=Ignicoccus pacificus DSM 13166 TaxID=940294 RepID=A0A977KBW4_9CREN|nr:hypothetical protein IPA_08945 [Ignicoccus pacificus DSM 13166]
MPHRGSWVSRARGTQLKPIASNCKKGKDLRIAVVSSYPPMPCGIGEYARSLAESLADRGHEVVVIATKWKNAPEVENGKVRVVRAWERGSEAFHRQILRAIAEEGPFDVIEFQYEYGLWPVIPLDPRGLWLLENSHDFANSIVATLHTVRVRNDPMWKEYHERLIKLSDAIILHHVIQEIALNSMITPEKVHVIPHGSDRLPGKREELNYERPISLLYGLLRKDKGLEVAVRAFRKLRRGTLLLAGKPLKKEDEEYVKEIVKEFKGRIVWIDEYLSRERLGTLIRSSDYVLFPYKDYPNDYGISGALHTVVGTGGKPLCSRTQRLIECWEVAKEATFSVGDYNALAKLIEKGLPEDVWGRLWRLGDHTSWQSVAILRERLYWELS